MNQEIKKVKILIVEDSKSNIDILVGALAENYELLVAINGVNALEAVEENTPDLILLDIMMPGMDGYEVCFRLKNNPQYSDIPVIFLTAKTASKDIVKGLEVGAVDYLIKPYTITELKARIKTHLELMENRQIIKEQNKKLTLFNQELEKKNVEHKELLHILCHDLHNPLGGINAICNILNKTLEGEEEKKYVDLIQTASSNGIQVISLVRKMSELDEYQLPLEEVDISKALHISQSMLQAQLAEKNIRLETQIQEGTKVRADKTSLINSVINNILTNALKFSYPGSAIEVNTENHNGEIAVCFRDYGIGMPERIVDVLFNINAKTSRTGTNGEVGTGFGMPLVKKFMEAYGGSIGVQSTQEKTAPDNHGTRVTLTFLSP